MATQYAWVIEGGREGTGHYLTVDAYTFAWTRDCNKAIRFTRREDADMVAAVIGEDCDSIVEHGWDA